MRPIGPCPNCGQSDYKPPQYRPTMAIGRKTDTHCPKCGDLLLSDCNSCKGTGFTTTYPLPLSEKYCSECGRENKPEDEPCDSCGGTGEIIDKHYFCRGR